MLQPRLHSSARSQLASPLSRSLLLSFYRLSISPSTTSSPSNQQTRSASHASQGRANKAAQGPGKRLGAKKSDSELVVPGNIIFRQRGTHWFPGENCGMGRDHTIFALAKGFVRYYRDLGRPGAAGEKKYIGVVFDQTMKLPRGRNEARRRRLGMEMSTMAQKPEGETESIEDSAPATEVSKSAAGSKNIKTASPPNVPPVTLRPGYTYMESNWSIGRAAERAGVKVRTYKPNNRFLAWRKATLRRAKNAELRGLSRKNKK